MDEESWDEPSDTGGGTATATSNESNEDHTDNTKDIPSEKSEPVDLFKVPTQVKAKAKDYFLNDDDITNEEPSESREKSPKVVEDTSSQIPLLSSEEEYQRLLKEGNISPKKWTGDEVIEFLTINGLSAHVEAFKSSKTDGKKFLQFNKETLALKIGLHETLIVARIIARLRNLEDAYIKKHAPPTSPVMADIFPSTNFLDFRIPKRKNSDPFEMGSTSRSLLTSPRFPEKRPRLSDEGNFTSDNQSNNFPGGRGFFRGGRGTDRGNGGRDRGGGFQDKGRYRDSFSSTPAAPTAEDEDWDAPSTPAQKSSGVARDTSFSSTPSATADDDDWGGGSGNSTPNTQNNSFRGGRGGFRGGRGRGDWGNGGRGRGGGYQDKGRFRDSFSSTPAAPTAEDEDWDAPSTPAQKSSGAARDTSFSSTPSATADDDDWGGGSGNSTPNTQNNSFRGGRGGYRGGRGRGDWGNGGRDRGGGYQDKGRYRGGDSFSSTPAATTAEDEDWDAPRTPAQKSSGAASARDTSFNSTPSATADDDDWGGGSGNSTPNTQNNSFRGGRGGFRGGRGRGDWGNGGRGRGGGYQDKGRFRDSFSSTPAATTAEDEDWDAPSTPVQKSSGATSARDTSFSSTPSATADDDDWGGGSGNSTPNTQNNSFRGGRGGFRGGRGRGDWGNGGRGRGGGYQDKGRFRDSFSSTPAATTAEDADWDAPSTPAQKSSGAGRDTSFSSTPSATADDDDWGGGSGNSTPNTQNNSFCGGRGGFRGGRGRGDWGNGGRGGFRGGRGRGEWGNGGRGGGGGHQDKGRFRDSFSNTPAPTTDEDWD